MADATPTSNVQYLQQALGLIDQLGLGGLTGSTGTGTGTTSRLTSLPSTDKSAAAWTAQDIASQFGTGSIPFGNVITFGQSPTQQSQTAAQNLASMINQAAGIAAQGGYTVPEPAEGMTEEEYMNFLSILQNQQATQQREGATNQVTQLISNMLGNAMSSPLLQQAKTAAQGTGMDWDLYNNMRTSAEALYDPRAAGIAAAASGGAGSSASQLAANQARLGQAGTIAGLYPQALQTSDALRTAETERLLQPTLAESSIGSNYANILSNLLGSLYGDLSRTIVS